MYSSGDSAAVQPGSGQEAVLQGVQDCVRAGAVCETHGVEMRRVVTWKSVGARRIATLSWSCDNKENCNVNHQTSTASQLS